MARPTRRVAAPGEGKGVSAAQSTRGPAQRGLAGDTKRFKDPNKFASHLTLRQRGTVTVPLRDPAEGGVGEGSGSGSAAAGGASSE